MKQTRQKEKANSRSRNSVRAQPGPPTYPATPMGEFEIIERFFKRGPQRDDVVVGIGDDAALVRVPPGHTLALAVDTMVEGVHFPKTCAPFDIGHKALAVNLSDLAAMGAEPAWATLALTLPQADPQWVASFSEGMRALAERYNVALVGGDTTRGPLSVTVQVQGFVPEGGGLLRSGAKAGDLICVTGTLGDAGLALQALEGVCTVDAVHDNALSQRLHRPEPRIAEGLALRGIASAVIDVSDGLIADLGHILEASRVGATIELARVPVSEAYRSVYEDDGLKLALTAGDDYELCFTVAPEQHSNMRRALQDSSCGVTCIGRVTGDEGLWCVQADGRKVRVERGGYEHFTDGAAGC